LWTDADNRALIQQHYAWFLPIYDNYPEAIMRVDAARYFILYHHGGVYVDLDFECLRPIETLLAGKEFVIGLEPTVHLERALPQERQLDRILCNAFIASVPRHLFWEHLFKQLVARHLEPHPLDATGPFFMTEAYNLFKQPDKISIEPAKTLYPLSEGDLWQYNSTKQPYTIPDEAFAIHHWQGTWWRKKHRTWFEQNLREGAKWTLKTAPKLWNRWKSSVQEQKNRFKNTIKERFYPYSRKIKLHWLNSRTWRPISLSNVAEPDNQIWFAVQLSGQIIARAVLDEAQCLRFVEQTNNLPRVSAMMVTKGRPQLAQRAVRCF
jgi:hypothetical protein